MSSISSSLTSAGLPGQTTASGTPDRFSELSSADFVKIMFSELTTQDPLKPNDSNTLLQQMSSLRNIEADITLEDKLGSVATQTQFATAGGLLGKYISGYTSDFSPVEGFVKSISNTSDGAVLNLDNGASVPFKNLQEILDPPSGTNPSPNPNPNPNPNPTPTILPASTARPSSASPLPTGAGPA